MLKATNNRQLSDLVPLIFDLLFQFIHFLPIVVLHLNKFCPRSSTVSIRKTERRQESASGGANLRSSAQIRPSIIRMRTMIKMVPRRPTPP